MTTAAALLLTWSLWWMLVIGTSVPARRPFYKSADQLPSLIKRAAKMTSTEVFAFSLHGGWPAANSALRALASLLAVAASFTFAYLAALLPARAARLIFLIVLALVSALAFLAFAMDAASVAKTASECRKRECKSSVPQSILDTGAICKCSPDAWFYLTLFVDLMLLVSAASCLVLTLLPMLGCGGRGDAAIDAPPPSVGSRDE